MDGFNVEERVGEKWGDGLKRQKEKCVYLYRCWLLGVFTGE